MSTTEETKIDWSKPVQTKETPPRKVRILTTEAAGDYPVIGNIEGDKTYTSWTSDGHRLSGIYSADVQNTPAWKLPDPPANQQWHRNDWTEEMLPAGYRPLLLGEMPVKGDQVYSTSWDSWILQTEGQTKVSASRFQKFQRTTRPIPQQPEQWAAEKAAFAAGEAIQWASKTSPSLWFDCETPHPFWLKENLYRIKPKQQKFPLEPCDVPPGSVIRFIGNDEFESDLEGEWSVILNTDKKKGVMVSAFDEFKEPYLEVFTWDYLIKSCQIKRPTDAEFQPCYKLIDPQ